MITTKKPLNLVTIVSVVLCLILLGATMSVYFEYASKVANRDSQISAQKNQINNINRNITALQNQLASINAQISILQTELKGNVTALAKANSQIANLTQDLNFWEMYYAWS